ncbi:copper resistance CopC/CopD family protein [Jatrophihabitans sp. DSM 45814]
MSTALANFASKAEKPNRGRTALLAGLIVSFAFALLLALAPQASAHAVVVGSTPADGSRLATAPSSVTIQFDEAVGLNLGYLRVVDTAGRRVDTGTATHPGGDGSKVTVGLKSGLGDGSFLASYRVVSADSHPIAGSIRFVVGNGPLGLGGGPSGSTPVSATVATSLAVAHWLSFAGVGLVGGSWLIFSVWPAGQRRRSIRRAIWTGWAFAALGAIGEFLLQGPYAAGSSLATAWHGELLDATLHVNSGQLLSLRLVLLGVLGAVLTALLSDDDRRKPSWGPEAAAIVGVGIVVTFAASGHTQAANPRWFAVLVDAMHLTSMIVWLGGLAILVIAAFTKRRDDDYYATDLATVDEPEYAPEFVGAGGIAAVAGTGTRAATVTAERLATGGGAATGDGPTDETPTDDTPTGNDDDPDAVELAAGLPIFSRVALAAVATLAVTGTIQAWREVGTVDAITTTWYGRLVTAKVVLFIVLIGLGYVARGIVQRRDWTNKGGPLTRMRRTLLVEVIVGATVLGVTGVLIAQPPGKVALAAQRAKPQFTNVALSSTSSARVEITPGVHGSVQIEIDLTSPTTPTQVTATASLPSKELGPIAVPLQAAGPKSYTASGVILPSSGEWQITLTVQTSEFDSTTAIAKLHLS